MIDKIFKFFKKELKLTKTTIINKPNTKALKDTVVIFTHYINVDGLSRNIAMESIAMFSRNLRITEEDKISMGVKHVKQFFIPITKGKTRIEITTI